jgi:hypothetical protein
VGKRDAIALPLEKEPGQVEITGHWTNTETWPLVSRAAKRGPPTSEPSTFNWRLTPAAIDRLIVVRLWVRRRHGKAGHDKTPPNIPACMQTVWLQDELASSSRTLGAQG